MFIRKTKTRTHNACDYFSYRLVESVRVGEQVRQRTLVNLGAGFDVPREQWPELIAAIEATVSPTASLFEFPPYIAEHAERIAEQLHTHHAHSSADVRRVDINTMRHINVRSVGGESVAVHALDVLGMESLLESLGIGPRQRKLALAQIAARMLHPASELETFRWLSHDSALCERIGVPPTQLRLGRLYRAADVLLRNRKAIETALYERQCELFAHSCTVVLYDLTNTWFSGAAHSAPGEFGHSKQKRHDCPLVTLGLCLDSAGLVRRSEVLPGNVSEPGTLKAALKRLGLSGGSCTVVMDAGICSDDNLRWLSRQGYDWVVVDRRHAVIPETAPDTVTRTRQQAEVRIWRLQDGAHDEARLCVHSSAREKTEQSMLSVPRQRLEEALKQLHEGLSKPRRMKRYPRVVEKIGRLRQQYRSVSCQYDIEVKPDAKGHHAIAVEWRRNGKHEERERNAGAYLLRTSLTQWDNERIVGLYWTLSEVEATFRSLKSELGLRPIYHRTRKRVQGHLLISVLAYQAVHTLRMMLRAQGETMSWQKIRHTLASIHRITTVMDESSGRRLAVRQNTQPSAEQRRLLRKMGTQVGLDRTLTSGTVSEMAPQK